MSDLELNGKYMCYTHWFLCLHCLFSCSVIHICILHALYKIYALFIPQTLYLYVFFLCMRILFPMHCMFRTQTYARLFYMHCYCACMLHVMYALTHSTFYAKSMFGTHFVFYRTCIFYAHSLLCFICYAFIFIYCRNLLLLAKQTASNIQQSYLSLYCTSLNILKN